MLSDDYKNVFLDSVLGVNASSEMPSSVWAGLLDDTDVECTGTDYVRVEITNDGTNFPPAASGLKTLAVDVDFPEVGAADWGTLSKCGIWDASTSGTLIGSARIAGAVIGDWPAGLIPHIPAGTLKFTYR